MGHLVLEPRVVVMGPLKSERSVTSEGNVVQLEPGDEARWITGAVFAVEGGVMAVTPLLRAGALRAVVGPG